MTNPAGTSERRQYARRQEDTDLGQHRLRGQVLDSQAGAEAPAVGVVVEIEPANEHDLLRTTLTDAAGNFVFSLEGLANRPGVHVVARGDDRFEAADEFVIFREGELGRDGIVLTRMPVVVLAAPEEGSEDPVVVAKEQAVGHAEERDTRGDRFCTAALDPLGESVAVGTEGGDVRIHDSQTGQLLREFESLGSEVWALAFEPHGRSLAGLTKDGKLRHWDAQTGELACEVDALTGEASRNPFGALLRFNPLGDRVLVADLRRGASLWTVGGELVHRWKEPQATSFSVRMTWSPDGERIAAADSGTVRMYDGRTGEQVQPSLECSSEITGLAFHPEGRILVTGHKDSHVRGWNLDTSELVYDEAFEAGMFPVFVPELRFSPDGRRLAISTCTYAQVTVIDWATAQGVWKSKGLGGRSGERVGVRWGYDGQRLWFAFESGSMSLFQMDLEEGGKEKKLMRGQPPWVSESGSVIVVSPDKLTALDADSGRVLWEH